MPDNRSLIEARDRLREWSRDEAHLGQSVRSHEPTYRNPAELRRDVRDVLDALGAAEALLRRISEWDALHPTVVAPYGDANYWLREIAKVLDA